MPTLRRLVTFVAPLAFAALAACGRSTPPASTAPLRADSVLSLRPGDVIKIQVWQHEELSGEFPVDENGNLLYPIVGELDVRTLSVQDLRLRIRTELGRLLTQPYVAVVPLFRVAVLGEVNKPGLYSVDPTLTVYDLVALAGGSTRAANDRELRLVRSGELYPLPLNATAIARSTLRELGVRSGDQLLVPRRTFTREDWLLILQIANLALGVYVLLVRR